MLKRLLNVALELTFKILLVYLVLMYGIPLYVKALSSILG